MLIDAHNHPNYHPNWRGHNVKEMLNNMDERGIDQMWVLSWECPTDEYRPSAFNPSGIGAPLEDVISVTSEAPDRLIAGYAPHPKRPDAVDRLKAAVEIHGVRVAGEYKTRTLFDDPDALRFYDACAELKVPITIHLDYAIDKYAERDHARPNWWYGGTIEALERAVAACPETVFIGHGGGFWAHIAGDDEFETEMYPKGLVMPGGKVPEMLTKYPNVYADLSGISGFNAITRDETFGRKFLLEHQHKLLFGRHSWDSSLMGHLMAIELPREVFDRLTFQNAQRLIGRT